MGDPGAGASPEPGRRDPDGLPRWLLVFLATYLSFFVHLLVFAPLLGRYLGRPTRSPPRDRAVEITVEKEAPEVAEAPERPRPDATVPRPERARPVPAPRPAPRVMPPRQSPPRPTPPPRPAPPKREPPRPVAPRPLQIELYKMKMVDQENPVDEPAPRDAKLLAQRNRDVKEQTRARHTNLDKHFDRTQLSAKSPKPIGSLTREEKTSTRLPERAAREKAGAPRRTEEPKPPREVAARPPQPEQPEQRLSLLAMRDRKPDQDREVLQPDRPKLSPHGVRPAPRPRPEPPRPLVGKASEALTPRPRLKLQLSPQDADRVFGRQWAAEWKERNQRRGSRGPESKRWDQIKAALENYLPEVKEGNQTALKTRAHPYAKFIAAMHRKIHPLWGDGFLEDLDRLGAHNAFNDYSRMAKLEVVLDNRGRVLKVGVVQTSGFLPFDVAALDVVYQAEPFPTPPQAILSPDGRVYLHWRFHRDHRQCGTFGVDPFILAAPPGGRQDRAQTGGAPHREGRMGRALGRREGASSESPPPRPHRAVGLDDRARAPATAWIVGFGQGQVDRMIRASSLPFTASGKQVAKTLGELRAVYGALISETTDRKPEATPELLTASGLRARLGSLPRGVEPGSDRLYVVTRHGGLDLVLILGQSDRGWAVVGLAR